MGGDCASGHYLVVANVGVRLVVSKQKAHNFDGERFCIRKLSDQQFRKQYQIKISYRSVDVENLSDTEEIIRGWENVTNPSNGSLGLYELKQHKTWFDEECLRFLNQRKQARFRI